MKIGCVYMMLILPAFKVKVGYTDSLLKRRADIQKSLKWQIVIPINLIYSIHYKEAEKKIHNVFDFCRYTWKGSGATEYFWLIIAPFIWVFMLFFQLFKIVKTILILSALAVLVYFAFSIILNN